MGHTLLPRGSLWRVIPGETGGKAAINLTHYLGRTEFIPAVNHDIAGGAKKALAQELDADHYGGLAPYGRTPSFLHSLAFNDPLKGLSPELLRFSVLGPQADIAFIDDARKHFVITSPFSTTDLVCRCDFSPRRISRKLSVGRSSTSMRETRVAN